MCDLRSGVPHNGRHVKLVPSKDQTFPGIYLERMTDGPSPLRVSFRVTIVNQQDQEKNIVHGKAVILCVVSTGSADINIRAEIQPQMLAATKVASAHDTLPRDNKDVMNALQTLSMFTRLSEAT